MDEEPEVSKMAELFPHSIEITKGQKGGYGWTVKIRFPAAQTIEPQRMAKVMADVDLELRKHFEAEQSKA